jgi:hypothetical protein
MLLSSIRSSECMERCKDAKGIPHGYTEKKVD